MGRFASIQCVLVEINIKTCLYFLNKYQLAEEV